MLSQLSPDGACFLSKISDKGGIARIGIVIKFKVSEFQGFKVSAFQGLRAQNALPWSAVESCSQSSLLQSTATTKISHGRYFSVSRAAL
jgi:hypothetical protein